MTQAKAAELWTLLEQSSFDAPGAVFIETFLGALQERGDFTPPAEHDVFDPVVAEFPAIANGGEVHPGVRMTRSLNGGVNLVDDNGRPQGHMGALEQGRFMRAQAALNTPPPFGYTRDGKKGF